MHYRTKLTHLWFVAAAASSLLAHAASAQETPAPTVTEGKGASRDDLEVIVVTANKRAQNLTEVPAAVTALSGDALALKGQENINDLNGSVPGLQIATQGSETSITLRGVGHALYSAAAENSVAMHLDGVYMGTPTSAASAFFDVDRIEVVRGPQGTLYGRNATGGAINIISEAPTDSFSGNVSATYGNYNKADVSGVVSGPISDDLSLRAGGYYNSHGGYGHNLANGEAVDNLNESGGKASLRYHPTEDLNVLIRTDYYHDDDALGNYHYAGIVRQPFPGAPTVSSIVDGILGIQPLTNIRDQDSEVTNHRHVELWGTTAEVSYNLTGSLSVKSLTGFRQSVSHYITNLDGSPVEVFGPFSFDSWANQRSEELQLNWKTDNLYVVAGAYYFGQDAHSRLFIDSYLAEGIPALRIPRILPAPSGVFNQTGKERTDAEAVFANADWNVTDDLTLGGGVRYSVEAKSNAGAELAFFPPAIHVDETKRSDAVTPRFTADYKLDSSLNLYGSISKGFKSGEFITGTTQYAKPEYLWAYEAGVKGSALDQKLRGSFSAFYYDYTDLQVQRIQTPLSFLDNVPKGVLKGFEAEGSLKLPYEVTLDGNVTYLQTRMVGFITQNPNIPGTPTVDLTGNRFAFAPDWTLNLGVQKWISLGTFGHGRLRVDAQYTSDTYEDVFNSRGTNFRPAYSLWNASYMHTLPDSNWSLLFWGKNLTNRIVYMATTTTSEPNLLFKTGAPAGMSPRAVASLELVNLNDPRTFGVTVKFSW
jgi:iron complex outermembrane receptor protein